MPALVPTVGEVAPRLLEIYLPNHKVLREDPVRQPDTTARLTYHSENTLSVTPGRRQRQPQAQLHPNCVDVTRSIC